MSIPAIMGIVNVTPDSFSDGGHFYKSDDAIAHGLKLIADGADILDIGGESTRPRAAAVTPEEEQARVVPVIKGLAAEAARKGVRLSIDTRNGGTMRAAINAGASIINDISALTHDDAAAANLADSATQIVLMHMQGSPATMQEAPHYTDVVQEVYDYLAARIQACANAGIARERLIIDPGIGFGKNRDHNIALLQNLAHFADLGVPLLVGASRKSFIAHVAGDASADQRLGGSLAVALHAAATGAAILRVHDVRETRQALLLQAALTGQKPAI